MSGKKQGELDDERARSPGAENTIWNELRRPSESGAVQRLLKDEVSGDSKATSIGQRAPTRTAADAHGKSSQSSDGESLHAVVRRERCCVILGDPGAGKSVLCRWLARELAECRIRQQRSKELGPARIPFVIVLRHLAEYAAKTDTPSITDYLKRTYPITPQDAADMWERFVEHTLSRGKAFLILDGMDEVPSNALLGMRSMINAFAEERVLSSATTTSRPDDGVGNQIVVTSRITGYYQVQLPPRPFAHFLIRPMSDSRIREFCCNWCDGSNCPHMTDDLLAEIFNPRQTSIRSMARNPLLLSILCQLRTKDPDSKAQLPRIRAELYEKAVYETAERWRAAAHIALREEEPYFKQLFSGVDSVLALFAPAAGYVHARFISNEIDATELQRWLVKAMAWFEGKKEHELEGDEWDRRGHFFRALEQVVGVLSERSPGRYSFLHLTFQEYLAGISLLMSELSARATAPRILNASAEEIVNRIINNAYLSDPRWRQPLLLLCGQLAWMEKCSRQDERRQAVALSEVISLLDERQARGETGLLGEQWAMFLAEVLNEVPEEMLVHSGKVSVVVVQTMSQLLDAYCRFGPGDDQQRGRLPFAERLAVIRRQVGVDAFESVLFGVSDAQTGSHRTAAAAHLLRARAWISQRATDFLTERLDRDSSEWEWAMHRLLRQAATFVPFQNIPELDGSFVAPPPEKVRELRRYREALPERQRLVLEWGERVRPEASVLSLRARSLRGSFSDARWERLHANPQEALLVTAALGGFGDYGARKRSEKYAEYSVWLQQSDHVREASLDAEPWKYVPWFGAEDTVYGMAVHLDTLGKRLYTSTVRPAQRAEYIVRWTALSIDIAHAVAGERRIFDVMTAKESISRRDWDRCELMAISRVAGLDETARWHGPLDLGDSERLKKHLERIQDDMSDACFRGAEEVQAWFGAEHGSMPDAEWHLVNRVLCAAWSASGVLGCKARGSERRALPPDAYSDVAEAWVQVFLAKRDDVVYNFQVALDDSWIANTPQEHQALLRAIARSFKHASVKLNMPDLLDLGAGHVSLPPLPFYEAIVELGGCAADRVRLDLASGWIEASLKRLIRIDPVAEAYVWLHAPSDVHGDHVAVLPPAMVRWRSMLCLWLLPLTVGGSLVTVDLNAPSMEWIRTWDACPQQEYRLALIRDAAALGIVSHPAVLQCARAQLITLDPEWCIEGALVAGYLARSIGHNGAATWLRISLDCVERAVDEDWKAEVLSVLMPLINGFGAQPEQDRWGELREELSERHQAIADGCPMRWVRRWAIANWPKDEAVRSGLIAALLVAAAHEEQVRQPSDQTIGVAELWKDLAKAFERRGSPHELGSIVDRLINAGDTRSLALSESAVELPRPAAG